MLSSDHDSTIALLIPQHMRLLVCQYPVMGDEGAFELSFSRDLR